jgi:transcriptional regulator with XRE-family HTH domain
MGSQQQLGKNIKKARQKAKMTQTEVAEKAGIHANYYARIERGEHNPSVDILEAIAKALKVKSSDILPF